MTPLRYSCCVTLKMHFWVTSMFTLEKEMHQNMDLGHIATLRLGWLGTLPESISVYISIIISQVFSWWSICYLISTLAGQCGWIGEDFQMIWKVAFVFREVNLWLDKKGNLTASVWQDKKPVAFLMMSDPGGSSSSNQTAPAPGIETDSTVNPIQQMSTVYTRL